VAVAGIPLLPLAVGCARVAPEADFQYSSRMAWPSLTIPLRFDEKTQKMKYLSCLAAELPSADIPVDCLTV
jgi:hypothetical protein